MLEMAEAVGTTWTKKRWDSFRLVTENSLCKLPDFPCTKIGEDPRGFMARDICIIDLYTIYMHNTSIYMHNRSI